MENDIPRPVVTMENAKMFLWYYGELIMSQDSFIFSAQNNKVIISQINILAQGGVGNDRTVF